MRLLLVALLSLITLAYANKEKPLIKVAIVDSGLDLNDERFKDQLCPEGHKDFTGTTIKDVLGHGTHVAGLIKKYAGTGNYCFLIYKYYLDSNPGSVNLSNEVASLRAAVKDGATLVNFSGGGADFNEDEYSIIKNNPDVTFVVAAGNEHQDIDKPESRYYPASYDLQNEIVVGNIDINGNKVPSSNWGSKVTVKEVGNLVRSTLPNNKCGYANCVGYMTGTSQSTAIHTGKMIREMLNAK